LFFSGVFLLAAANIGFAVKAAKTQVGMASAKRKLLAGKFGKLHGNTRFPVPV
jgi:hypothetical protein